MKRVLLLTATTLFFVATVPALQPSHAFASYGHGHAKHHPNLSAKQVKKLDHGHAKHHKRSSPQPDTTRPETSIINGFYSVRAGTKVDYNFRANEPAHFECRHWGFGRDVTWNEAHGVGIPWEPCRSSDASSSYVVSDDYYQSFEVRAIDQAGNVDSTPDGDSFTTYNW